MNLYFCFGILLIGVGTGLLSFSSAKEATVGYVKKSDVVEAMSGDWTSNTFAYQAGSPPITDTKGNTHFYAVSDVQERIDKLNKVLEK